MTGDGFKSRKFILAFMVTIVGSAAAFGLPALASFAWLREYSFQIFTAIVGLVGAYIAGNAIVDWVHKDKT
jgi:hypothetical protein